MATTAHDIDELRDHVLREMGNRLYEMSNEAYKHVIEELEKELTIDKGRIVVKEDFVKRLNDLVGNILKRLQTSTKFTGSVSLFVKRLEDISLAIKEFQQATNKIKVPDFETAKKVVIDEIINAMLDSGLNQHFAQPLRDLIYRNATTATGGLSLAQAKEMIKEYIKGGKDESGKLHRYILQTAQQGVDLYTGAINKKLMETFDYNALLVTGTIIDNSSPQCRYAIDDLNGKIRREDWPEVRKRATKRFQLVEGTTFENLPIKLLHWGCRHSFYPMMQ